MVYIVSGYGYSKGTCGGVGVAKLGSVNGCCSEMCTCRRLLCYDIVWKIVVAIHL